ncbi:unnamed protein product, partial [Ectocarpus sp. 12 AP-2014]
TANTSFCLRFVLDVSVKGLGVGDIRTHNLTSVGRSGGWTSEPDGYYIRAISQSIQEYLSVDSPTHSTGQQQNTCLCRRNVELSLDLASVFLCLILLLAPALRLQLEDQA